MNFTPLNVVLIMTGIVLIYAAIKDLNPKEVISNSLQGKSTTGAPPAEGKYNKKPRSSTNITPPGLPDYPVTSV